MKNKLISIFIIISIVLVAVFGIFAFDMAMHGGDMECPLAVFSGATCSAMTTAFTMTLHHIAGFQDLIQSVLSSNMSLLILFLLMFVFIVFVRSVHQEILEYKTSLFEIFRADKKTRPNRFVYVLQKWFVSIRNKDNISYALAYETSV